MISIPLASPSDFIDTLIPLKAKNTHLWFIFAKDCLLVEEKQKKLPKVPLPSVEASLHIGTWQKKSFFAAEVASSTAAPAGYCFLPLRSLHPLMEETLYALAGRGLHLLHWNRTHKYCGSCGALTFARSHERCIECSSCGHLSYPTIAPVIMALITRKNKLLLARSPHFPKDIYSILAGFVSPGETLEQCVTREVFEEVGLKVKNIQYSASQPWPFSQSLMIGFTCEWASGKLTIDSTEIEDALWCDPSSLPSLPSHLSLARVMIDTHLKNHSS